MTETVAVPQGPSAADIVARAGTYFRNARYIIFLMMCGFGIAFLYDGLVRYPKEREDFFKLSPYQQGVANAPHTELDITIQRVLGFSLTPLSIVLLARWLYISRGTYRLVGGTTLHVPGHPPVPVDSIVALDKALWERKGIARIDYELPDGKAGAIYLDDFVYQRDPTDKIVEVIEHHLNPEGVVDAAQESRAGVDTNDATLTPSEASMRIDDQ